MNKFVNNELFLIAEVSANHNGSLSHAKKLINMAKRCGADAVKLQTYTPDMMTIKENVINFKIKKGLWKGYALWDLYNLGQTPLEWHKSLFKYARSKKIKIFSTPFSEEAVSFLEKLNCPAYKIASFEMNDYNLVKAAAKTTKPLILSTGLSTMSEIENAVLIAKKNGCIDLTLLYCVSNYPSQSADFNLGYINEFKKRFECRVGLSDHSLGSEIAKYSLFAGATVFEKHIALQDQKKGLDLDFSLKEKEFKAYNQALKKAFQLIGNNNFNRSKNEMENKIFRRSIYAIKDIKKGDILTKKNIKTFRPERGISAAYYLDILKKKSPIDIKKNYPLPKKILNKIL
jgi:pseudaminic acid synthase